MNIIRRLWRRYVTTILVLLALIAGAIWGINIGRELGPTQPTPFPTSTPYPTYTPTPTPTGEYIEIQPGQQLELTLETPEPGTTPPAEPHVLVRVDIRDKITEKPVRGDVWITVDGGEDQLMALSTSLTEFALPKGDEILVKVQAKGYLLWVVGVRGNIVYDRLIPLPVMLEPLPGQGRGSG